MANFKLKKIKDEPIGKLIRPIKLYKGFIFPNEIKKNKNFSEWFSSSVRLQCRFQSTKEAVTSYKIFSKSLDKNIIKQYKELSLNDTIDHNKILNGYAAEITGFIYFYKKEYHLCKSKKEEAAIIKKIKNGNINILFVIVKLYKNVDLKKEKGLEEWDYHSTESFELIYPVKQTILLNYILKIESVMPGQSLKSTKQEYIVLSKERKDNLNIIYNSLSFYKIFCLGQHLMKNVNFNTYYSILD